MTQPALSTETQPLDDARMWQAVIDDDAHYDGAFYVAVKTTHIYCRPSCKARTPLRENVVFYPDAESARAAGFRACKRCRPDESADANAQTIAEVCRYIDAHAHELRITLDHLAAQFHISPFHLHRTFKRIMGITPAAYVDSARMRAFKQELRGAGSVTDAVYAAGFSSDSQVYARTGDHLGMTPTAYRVGAPVEIAFATARCPFGVLLVGMTERGICAVKLGDTSDALIADLQAEFPAAQLCEDPEALHPMLTAINRYLNGETPHLDLPLDIQATAFQRRVWEALRQIPYGETRTYAEIARAIDAPKAARAVGNACADNQTALIIPCHRVVRGDGVIGHYRWGSDRKKRLLAMEKGG
ncbi:MAG: bifunctional DNA-binding transcriptional regulator/O6-methylguanine-DNA methyltransferase Ada [Chloroflexi bacterium]|nr:bifunctional DNA-binding transcriptional regulator/O6-methylguanine-DNA methyltransferase Ada [Chloroflexota bacterium]